MNKISFIISIIFVTGFFACNKDDSFKKPDAVFSLDKPAYFPSLKYRIEHNQISKEKFELGKKLFYDVALSATNTISCASCHRQSAAFADAGNAVSIGINQQKGVRNSPAIMNLAWNPLFMWDGGIADLDLQSIAPLTNHLEMGTSVSDVLKKLNSDTEYRSLFKKAYGENEITSVAFLKSLSQFMVMCVSDQSKYDSVMRKEAMFNEAEQKGHLLFQQHCNSCHQEPLFTANTFKNNGIASADSGRYQVTLLSADLFKFKVPSLRNLKYTSPYMHNGQINTVEEVIDFYAKPKTFAYADESIKNGISMTKQEQQQLIAFLNTLNDEKFVTNKLLSGN